MKQLSLQIHTWNVAGLSSIDDVALTKLFDFEHNVDLYSISLQEIATGVVETALSYISYDGWTRTLLSIMPRHGYFLVENVRVQGMSLSIFARLCHLPYIRFIKSDIRRTGLGGNWTCETSKCNGLCPSCGSQPVESSFSILIQHLQTLNHCGKELICCLGNFMETTLPQGNKGGVAVSSNIYGKRICFLNTHLPAQMEFNAARVEHFEDIIESMEFDGTTTVLSHDVVFWAGDSNFRIDNTPRPEVLKLVGEKNYQELLNNDQLKKHLADHDVIKEFKEGPITFPPSFKFDMGTDTYDTSEKQRKPAWTDRILCRVNPDGRTLIDALRDISIATASPTSSPTRKNSPNLVELIEGSYNSLAYMKQSDHKPVIAQYALNITKDVHFLVEVRADGVWSSERGGEVVISYHKDMKPEERDYLALYEERFTDFRSYKTWTYVPTSPQDPPPNPHRCKFPAPVILETSQCRVGYYSPKMSCLLGLSDPFTIRLG